MYMHRSHIDSIEDIDTATGMTSISTYYYTDKGQEIDDKEEYLKNL